MLYLNIVDYFLGIWLGFKWKLYWSIENRVLDNLEEDLDVCWYLCE